MQQTRLSRRWMVKMLIFILAAAGLGIWGLVDATIAYPARGRSHAEYMEYQYLLAMGQAGLPVLPVEDPKEAIRALRNEKDDLEMRRARAEASDQKIEMARTSAALTMLQWLVALERVGDLDPGHTVHANPSERFSELSAKWQAKDQPKPLSGFDIPMQWGFVVIGFGLAAHLSLLIARVGSKKYRYNPETKQLTFPDGSSITPGDIEDIDKRKWDKFIVQIKAGGKTRKLDLLRYDPLEEWFLEMEKETPFYEPPEGDDATEVVAGRDVDEDRSAETPESSGREQPTETA